MTTTLPQIPEPVVDLLWSRVKLAKQMGVHHRIRQGLRYDLDELQDCWPERAHRPSVPRSQAARAPNADERWEHSVPLRVLFDMMVACNTPEEMVSVLENFFHCAVIPVEENKCINALHPPKQDESQTNLHGNPPDSGFPRNALEGTRDA